MATNYPTNLDTLTNPTATDKLNSPSHADQHANSNDAIEALQVKVGADGSAVTSSHDYKLSGVTGSDKAVSLAGTETLTNKTLTTPTIISPDITTPNITTSINDVNGNEVIETPATASAVNHLKVTNAITGNDVDVAPAGDDTNVGLKLKGKGTGTVKLGDAELAFPDSDGSNGTFLQTDGSGNLTFAATAGGVKFRAYKTSGQAIASGYVKITWDTENFDTGSDFASNTFTAPEDGYYLITVNLQISRTATADDTMGAAIYVNGSRVAEDINKTGDEDVSSSVTDLQFLSASDTVEAYGYTSDTTGTSVKSGTSGSSFSIAQII